jgi:hypothetical protein
VTSSTIKLRRVPVLDLLHPREYTVLLVTFVALAVVAGYALVLWRDWPLWAATALVLVAMAPPLAVKWRSDVRRLGWVAALLSLVLTAQLLHTFEHVAQVVQYHVLNYTPRASNGLLSPANSEWVHFVWNWTILGTVAALLIGGMRNRWTWLLLIWATAHTAEHTYLFVQYQLVLRELAGFGVTSIPAQGLPGVLGQNGWLARSDVTRGTFLCTLPGLTTASRIDVHAWWNIGETTLLLAAAHRHLRVLFSSVGKDK